MEELYLHLFVSHPYYSAYDIGHIKKIQDGTGNDKLNDNAYRQAKIHCKKT